MIALLICLSAAAPLAASTQPATAPDSGLWTHNTSAGVLGIFPINHSALRFEFKGKQYYVDPAGKADWQKMPKADAILITHEHPDHLDPKVIEVRVLPLP